MAGSTTLALQTVLPALVRAGRLSTLVIEDGTHNPLAPTAEFLVEKFLPVEISHSETSGGAWQVIVAI